MAQVPAGGGGVPTGTDFADEAEKFAGDPYVYGAAGPSSFDCSGLMQYALGQLGISAPRTSEDQWAWVKRISSKSLQPGDLVFAQFAGDGASPGHVGVYAGGGKVFSAQDPSAGIGYSTLTSWGSNIVGYGRVPGLTYAGETSGSGPSGSGSGDSGTIPGALADVLSGIAAALGGDVDAAPGISTLDPISAVATAIADIAKEFEGLKTILTWLTVPSHWVRIFAGIAGTMFLGAGIWFIVQEAA